MAGEMQIKFVHGQFRVYDIDPDGRESLVTTFGTLAAAREAFPQADPDADAMIAVPVRQGLSKQDKWLIGCGIALGVLLLLVLAIVISYLSTDY